jgi:hypothetical protein
MRKITSLLLTLAILGLFCIPNESSAVGLGIYIPTVGTGTSTLKIEDFEFPNDIDNSHFGFGFVLDTKVANPGVFNYRLHIGFESFELGNSNFREDNELDDNLSRYSIDNTFGFAVLQSSVVRLWLGPQIRLSYMHYSNDYIDLNLIGLGFAPVLGVNFNMGDVFTLAPELGYRFSFYGGTNSYNSDDYWLTDDEEDWTLNNREFFIKLNIIFRINDYYL